MSLERMSLVTHGSVYISIDCLTCVYCSVPCVSLST